jgi:tetratricopeptide (TPR) repeat protein
MTQTFSFILVLLLFIPARWTEIAKRNRAIERAEQAYKTADYETSVREHLALKNEHGVFSPQADFNLNLSFQLNGQEGEAQRGFQELYESTNRLIASKAANQNGVIFGREEDYDNALSAFRAALVRDPNNETARYNYELLARWLEQRQDPPEKEEEQPDEDQLKPSNYAKRMKAEADKMVDQFRFDEALDIMERAMQIDETVAYYQEFIKNLIDIDEINNN